MENIKILPMHLADFEEIKDFLISDFDDFWQPSILKSELMGENKKYVVAKKREEIVGFAGILFIKPDAEVMNIVVKKSERRKGIGNLLLNKMIEIAENNFMERIFLEVKESNGGAIKLYKDAGFLEIGKRKGYYDGKVDAILLSKNVKNL